MSLTIIGRRLHVLFIYSPIEIIMIPIETHRLACGLTVVLEPIQSVTSVALRWLLPMGSATDPADRQGYSTLLSELIFRGAGELSSREHSDALDRLGIQRSSQVQSHHLRIDATMMADHLHEGLKLIVPMVLTPTLPADGLDSVRSLCLQSLESLADDPQHLVMLRVRQQHLPSPFNRTGYGEEVALRDACIEDLREFRASRCRPRNSILGIAGQIEPESLIPILDGLLEGWSGTTDDPQELEPGRRGVVSLSQSTSQVHIAVVFDAPREADDDSILERLAIGVLSGSTSGRLFTEVRQKRSLCYSVGASYGSGRDYGLVTMYAGTTPERAQETLDVSLGEIFRLRQGVEQAEFDRVVTGLKSQLIMQGESTPARATAIALDQFRLGGARSLSDITREIDAVSLGSLNDYLTRREYGEFTITSIGPVELKSPGLTV